VALLAAAWDAPARYKAPTGTAKDAAPSAAITSGLRTKDIKVMDSLLMGNHCTLWRTLDAPA
jgi:hypothetical protein